MSGHGTSRWAVGSLALAMLLASLGTSIANVALPALAHAFGASFAGVQWVVLAYLLAVTVLVVVAGRLGDVLGHRRVLLAGLAGFTVASVLCGAAPTLGLLIAARAVQGLAAAVLMAVTLALVRATVPAQRTGRAMGLLGTMSAVGTALGPALGGVLLAGPGWRAVFLVMAPLGLANLALARRHLPADDRPAGRAGPGLDGPGLLLLALTLSAYSLAVTVGGGATPTTAALVLAAALGAVLFVRVEARAAAPLVPLATLRRPVISASLTMNALVGTVMMTTLVVGPFYLSRTVGLGAGLVGAAMAVGPVISALTGLPAGRLVDRRGAPAMLTAGLAAMAAGCLGLATLTATHTAAGYLVAMAVLTPGYQVFLAANNTAVMMDARADQRGVISGLLSLFRNLGLVTGAAVMGALFAMATPLGGTAADVTTAGPQAVATGTQVTFAVATGLILVAVAVSVVAGRRAVTPVPAPSS